VKKKIVWFCGVPEKVRIEAFSDQGLRPGHSWSWVIGHLPPPAHIDLHIVCADRRLKENVTRVWNGATFHLLKVPRGGSYLMYRGWISAFTEKTRELAPDIVHSWGTEGGCGVAALRADPENHVIGIQGILAVTWPVMKKSLQLILSVLNERYVLQRARRCVAESDYSCRTVSRYTSAPVSMIPHPLREEFLAAAPGARSGKIIVYLGALAHRKGFFDAVKALLSLDSDWKLVCIGTADSAKDRQEVDRFLAGQQAGDRVVLTGSQTPAQIIEWFKKSPLFLLPSYTDTGPTALKEALSMGLWPVCYDNTGPQELIRRYGVGTLVPTGDVKQLAEALKRVLAERVWENNAALTSCGAKIRKDLTPAAIWEKLTQMYRDSTDPRTLGENGEGEAI
jgi:glycosyltransferase involved in cell wall biosynthesis